MEKSITFTIMFLRKLVKFIMSAKVAGRDSLNSKGEVNYGMLSIENMAVKL